MSTNSPTPLEPPRPESPDPRDCCGSGCSPCIFDIYEQELLRWHETVRALRAAQADAPPAAPEA